MIHALISLLVQAIIGLLTGNWWVGGVAGAAVYLGREHAQAEYRWIETYGLGLRANLPWWGAFDLRVWRKFDAWADWIGPSVAVLIVAGLA